MVSLNKIAMAVALELGEEWSVEPGQRFDGRDAYLRGVGDIRLRVATEHHRKYGSNRLFISEAVGGELGRFVQYDVVISVSKERAAKEVAAEIRRRLLPGAEEAIAKARADKAASDARDAEHQAMCEAMASALNGATYSHDPNKVHFGSSSDGVSGSVEVRKFGDNVKFEIAVPKSLASAMAESVSALRRVEVSKGCNPQVVSETVSKQETPTQGRSDETNGRSERRRQLTPEERKERHDALNGKLAEGIAELAEDEDRWAEFLTAAQGLAAAWSFNNIMLILLQAAERGFTPSMVKTSRAWNKLGRKIKTGEKALYIFEPMKYRLSLEEAQKQGKNGFDSDGKPRMTIRGVRPSPRFDVTQTEGEPIPEDRTTRAPVTEDEIAEVWETVATEIRATGYEVTGGPPGDVDSYTDPTAREVWVCDTLEDEAAITAALRELAHIRLNHLADADEYRQHRERMDREATTVAIIAAGALGLNTSSHDQPALTGWLEGNAELLAETAERVTATAQEIIRAFQGPAIPE